MVLLLRRDFQLRKRIIPLPVSRFFPKNLRDAAYDNSVPGARATRNEMLLKAFVYLLDYMGLENEKDLST